MARMGMDPDVVDGIGQQLKAQGGQIQELANSINQLVNQAVSAWEGADASQFHEWWTSKHQPALMAAAEAVSGLGQAAVNNAADQRAVSGH